MPLARPIGHDPVRHWLKTAMAGGRVAAAYMFAGPEGIGKSGLAIEFAAALRCQAGQGWACGQCNECARVARGVHPNVRVFAKPADKTEFPVELVREICDEAGVKQLEPGRRVFVVQDADRFNESSANALLKTLEEPPAGLTFVLLSANVAEVLPTILSRCQAVRFSALNLDQLAHVAGAWEGQPVNPQSRALLLRAAQGSPGRLRRMLEFGTLDCTESFLKHVARDPFAAAEALSAHVHESDDNEPRRDRLREVLGILSACLRDRLALSLGITDLPLLKAPDPGPAGADVLVAALARLDNLRLRVDGNVNLKLACDAAALAWPA